MPEIFQTQKTNGLTNGYGSYMELNISRSSNSSARNRHKLSNKTIIWECVHCSSATTSPAGKQFQRMLFNVSNRHVFEKKPWNGRYNNLDYGGADIFIRKTTRQYNKIQFLVQLHKCNDHCYHGTVYYRCCNNGELIFVCIIVTAILHRTAGR